MANLFVMAVGLDYAVDDNQQGRGLPSVVTVLTAIKISLSPTEIDKNRATLTFDNYEDAETLIKAIYEYCSDNGRTDKEKLCFDIFLMMGDPGNPIILAKAISLLASAMQERREKAYLYPVRVYITKEIYEDLKHSDQDLYHSPIEIASTHVHQRFSEDAQRCFVVSPIDDDGTEIRERADFVFERYIKPACENTHFRPVRGDMMEGTHITPELMEALQTDPMVIVYLGNPKWGGWNPNVFYELGVRVYHPGHYVVIKDDTSNGQPYKLPFNIKDNRIIDIPEGNENNLELGAIKIRTIREKILAGDNTNHGNYLYPGATVDLIIGDFSKKKSKFIEASEGLETLFDLKGIVGRDVDYVVNHIMGLMPLCQRQAFANEQAILIGQLLTNSESARTVRATIPIVFQDPHKYKGRAFLPIIVSYFFKAGLNPILRLRTLYIDVTSATKLDEQRGFYTCILTGNDQIGLSGAQN